MKISKAIETLAKILGEYGDIEITGGSMSDDVPLRKIVVTDVEGFEVWPRDPNNVSGDYPIDGVYFE